MFRLRSLARPSAVASQKIVHAVASLFWSTVSSATLLVLALAPMAQATQITLDNSSSQAFAVDPTRHFLYSAQNISGTAHLDVISTLSNTVVGTYSFSTSGFTTDIAASGTQVFWDDQGGSVQVLNVSSGGAPSFARADSFTFPTGIAALSTTYGESSQGGGDSLHIVQISNGSVLHTVSLGGGATASTVHADTLSSLYYVENPSNAEVIDTSGNLVRTVTGIVVAIDPGASHHFVYTGGGTTTLQQLNGSDDSSTGKSFTFGANITAAAVDSSGDVWVALNSSNLVEELTPNMTFIQQFTVSSPDVIAFDNGTAYVHEAGTNIIAVVPEPTCGVFFVLLGVGSLRRRRR